MVVRMINVLHRLMYFKLGPRKQQQIKADANVI